MIDLIDEIEHDGSILPADFEGVRLYYQTLYENRPADHTVILAQGLELDLESYVEDKTIYTIGMDLALYYAYGDDQYVHFRYIGPYYLLKDEKFCKNKFEYKNKDFSIKFKDINSLYLYNFKEGKLYSKVPMYHMKAVYKEFLTPKKLAKIINDNILYVFEKNNYADNEQYYNLKNCDDFDSYL